MNESQSLLAEYVHSRSEEAFGRLLECYVDLVYSTAIRLVRGDSHLAEDVAQTVFLHLAKKAHRLPQDVMLGGWLHQDTCFVATKMLRGERRRQLRERQAADLTMTTSDNVDFTEIAPILDEAVNQLGEEDRKAILLRFYERLDFRVIGERLGSSENAAQKRVSRALDQLHSSLLQRGVVVTLSAAALSTVLTTRAVEAAPAEVVASLAQAGLAGAAVGHGTALSLLKGLATSKVSLGVAGVVVLAGASWLALSSWWPWWPAKPPPLALNGTWTRLNKPQPLGCVTYPVAVALDQDGQLYVADDEEGGRIQKRDRDGNWSLVASGVTPGSYMNSLACDDSGCLYVAEYGRIQKRDREGHWTSLATLGRELGHVIFPYALALDPAGNLYVSDQDDRGKESIVLRRTDGQWTLLSGKGSGVGEFESTGGLATDTLGNLYVADKSANRIQQRDVTGRWSVVDVDPLAVGALSQPRSVAVDATGALYVVEGSGPNGRLLKRDADGRWSVLTTGGRELGTIGSANRLGIDSTGALYVTQWNPPWIQKRDPNGTWTVVCAASTEPGIFPTIGQLAVDGHGSLYVKDGRGLVQKRDPQGGWTVVLDAANQPGEIRTVGSFAVDRRDNLYVADPDFSRVMTRDSHGAWEVCMPSGAGIGQTQWPDYLSVDASDNLYVIDGKLNAPTTGRLQRRDRQGRWTVLAEAGTKPDGELGLGQLTAVAAAPNGNIYVADYFNFNRRQGRIRMLDPKGHWTTVAASGDELGQVGHVSGIATDSFGRLYVADYGYSRVQVRDVNGKWYEFSDGGSAGRSEFSGSLVNGVAVDRHGVLYVGTCAPTRALRWTPQPKAKATRVGSETKK